MILIRYLIIGYLFLACGLLINQALPPLIEFYIDSQLALTPSSQSYPAWKSPPVPIYQKFYFYNVTNAQNVEQKGHKPQLQEVGPFTYRLDSAKKDIEWPTAKERAGGDGQQPAPATDDNLIQFKHFKQWKFEPDMSIEDERLQLITLNAPLAITLSLIQSASSAVRLLVTFSLDGLSEGFFTKRSVKQLLFDGYPDLLTTFGPILNAEMLSQGGHFGYMNARNNNVDATYQVDTGADDIRKLNTINKFNGRSQLTYWHNYQHQPDGGPCNSLAGATPGDLFPPLEANQTSLKLFQPDFCRVLKLNHQRDLEHWSGLRLKRFLASMDIFRNSTDLPENACYFKRSPLRKEPAGQNRVPAAAAAAAAASASTHRHPLTADVRQARQEQGPGAAHAPDQAPAGQRHSSRPRSEWPAGVFTLAPCKFNAPIYISMPHFLGADPFFISHVEGLEPSQDRHQFYVDVEPRTGSPVTLSARVQLNVAISKPPGLVRFRNMPEIMFPVFWQELQVNLTGPVIDQLLLAAKEAPEVLEKVSYVFLLLGATILLTCAIFHLHQWLGAKLNSLHKPEAK